MRMTPGRQARRDRLEKVAHWVAYYGAPGMGWQRLAQFGLIVPDLGDFRDWPSPWPPDSLATLRSEGGLLVSYLNAGATEENRWYWDQAAPFQLAPYHGFAGEFYMKVSEAGFRELLIQQVARGLIHREIDGLFLDNLDMIVPFPDQHPGMVQLLAELRAAFPDHLLIGNNGLALQPDQTGTGIPVMSLLDGLVGESLVSLHQPLEPLSQTSQDHELVGLLIDYAETEALSASFAAVARGAGLIPYIATDRDLTQAPPLWAFPAPFQRPKDNATSETKHYGPRGSGR